jgi:hypothetical protein
LLGSSKGCDMKLVSDVFNVIRSRFESKHEELTWLSDDWHNFEKWFAFEAYFALREKYEPPPREIKKDVRSWNVHPEPCYFWWCDELSIEKSYLSAARADLAVTSGPDEESGGTVIIEAKVTRSAPSKDTIISDRLKMQQAAVMPLRKRAAKDFGGPLYYLQLIIVLGKQADCFVPIVDQEPKWAIVPGSPAEIGGKCVLMGYWMQHIAAGNIR